MNGRDSLIRRETRVLAITITITITSRSRSRSRSMSMSRKERPELGNADCSFYKAQC